MTRPVLVVEDDEYTRELVATCLKLGGIPVVTASNGKEGLERLAREEPSLILLDLNMPVMDGEQFRRAQLRNSRFSRIPTILLTAVHNAAQRAKDLGVGLLPKPFDLDQLVWVVRSITRRADPWAPSPSSTR
jgi:DNA-binding response OmpR family regulator